MPKPVLRHILALLPVDDRARCSAVCTEWKEALWDLSMWSVLDLSAKGGIARSRITSALRHGALKRAAGQLVSLDLRDCYKVKFESVLRMVQQAPALRVLRLQQYHSQDDGYSSFYGHELAELEALLRAAPELEVLYADVTLGASWIHGVWTGIDFDAALQMLRREERFKSLRLGHLIVRLSEDDAEAAVELMAALLSHGATPEALELWGWSFDDWPGALDAVVTATLSLRLTTLVLNACDLGPIAAPALPRLLSGTSLTNLHIAYDDRTQFLDENAAVLLASALRTNSTLTSLAFSAADLWCSPSAGAALFASLVAHPSLRSFIWREHYRCEHDALAGLALHALLAANAPALRRLEVHVMLDDDGLGPLLDALPRNTHVRCLDFWTLHISRSFACDRLLPAVRANTSLRRIFDAEQLGVDAEPPGAFDKSAESIMLEAFELVNSRGGMPADERN